MRHLAQLFPAIFLVGSAALLSACEDSTSSFFDPRLATDTVTLAAPTAQSDSLPTALDITATAGFIAGGRFPERSTQAEAFDFVVRQRNGELLLLPAGAIGLRSRAAITRPIQNRTFATLREAPGSNSFVTDTGVVLQTGSVYAARSRSFAGGVYGSCEQYAKLQPLELDPARATVRLQITTNERCGDPRLALED